MYQNIKDIGWSCYEVYIFIYVQDKISIWMFSRNGVFRYLQAAYLSSPICYVTKWKEVMIPHCCRHLWLRMSFETNYRSKCILHTYAFYVISFSEICKILYEKNKNYKVELFKRLHRVAHFFMGQIIMSLEIDIIKATAIKVGRYQL